MAAVASVSICVCLFHGLRSRGVACCRNSADAALEHTYAASSSSWDAGPSSSGAGPSSSGSHRHDWYSHSRRSSCCSVVQDSRKRRRLDRGALTIPSKGTHLYRGITELCRATSSPERALKTVQLHLRVAVSHMPHGRAREVDSMPSKMPIGTKHSALPKHPALPLSLHQPASCGVQYAG